MCSLQESKTKPVFVFDSLQESKTKTGFAEDVYEAG